MIQTNSPPKELESERYVLNISTSIFYFLEFIRLISVMVFIHSLLLQFITCRVQVDGVQRSLVIWLCSGARNFKVFIFPVMVLLSQQAATLIFPLP